MKKLLYILLFAFLATPLTYTQNNNNDIEKQKEKAMQKEAEKQKTAEEYQDETIDEQEGFIGWGQY